MHSITCQRRSILCWNVVCSFGRKCVVVVYVWMETRRSQQPSRHSRNSTRWMAWTAVWAHLPPPPPSIVMKWHISVRYVALAREFVIIRELERERERVKQSSPLLGRDEDKAVHQDRIISDCFLLCGHSFVIRIPVVGWWDKRTRTTHQWLVRVRSIRSPGRDLPSGSAVCGHCFYLCPQTWWTLKQMDFRRTIFLCPNFGHGRDRQHSLSAFCSTRETDQNCAFLFIVLIFFLPPLTRTLLACHLLVVHTFTYMPCGHRPSEWMPSCQHKNDQNRRENKSFWRHDTMIFFFFFFVRSAIVLLHRPFISHTQTVLEDESVFLSQLRVWPIKCMKWWYISSIFALLSCCFLPCAIANRHFRHRCRRAIHRDALSPHLHSDSQLLCTKNSDFTSSFFGQQTNEIENKWDKANEPKWG